MKDKKYFSTTEVGRLLGISRVAVLKKVKAGKIKAVRVGRTFVIDRKDLGGILGESLSREDELMIDRAVKKTIKEYGETLRLLGTA